MEKRAYVVVFDIPDLYICKIETLPLHDILTVGRNIASREAGTGTGCRFKVVQKPLLEIV